MVSLTLGISYMYSLCPRVPLGKSGRSSRPTSRIAEIVSPSRSRHVKTWFPRAVRRLFPAPRRAVNYSPSQWPQGHWGRSRHWNSFFSRSNERQPMKTWFLRRLPWFLPRFEGSVNMSLFHWSSGPW